MKQPPGTHIFIPNTSQHSEPSSQSLLVLQEPMHWPSGVQVFVPAMSQQVLPGEQSSLVWQALPTSQSTAVMQ